MGGLVISYEVERSDMKARRQLEFMRRYVKVVEGVSLLPQGVMLRLKKNWIVIRGCGGSVEN